jgi:ABC-type amino acid transport substrate-binding protein
VKIVMGAVALAACATILCPSAGAGDTSRLALMPLPRQALGADAKAFLLAKDSGVDSNADAASNAGSGVTAADLTSYGRITGYTLDYARPAASGLHVPRGLLNVKTIAELYRDNSTAAKGLVFWRRVTKESSSSTSDGVTVRLSSFDAHVNGNAFGFELTYQFAGKPFGYVGDIVFRTGDMLGAVFVTATDEAGLRTRTVSLANGLALRIKQVQAGKVTGPPVVLPSKK